MSTASVTPMFDVFVKFCSEQPPAKRIDHTEGYTECAIGDFTRHINTGASPYMVLIEIKDDLEIISPDLAEDFHVKIGDGSNDRSIATYGGLTTWLLQFQHSVHEAAQ